MEKIYTIENIDCANCAAKIEALMNKQPEVIEANITFATKRLKLVAENPDSLVSKLEELANTVENGVRILEKKKATVKKPARHIHEHHHSHEQHHSHEHHHPHEEKMDLGAHTHSHGEHGALSLLEGGASIIIGAILFAIGSSAFHWHLFNQVGVIGILVLAYIVLGGNILYTAFRNILKGQVFDENFLMSVATLGAMVIQEYPEAVGVMLFYRIGEYFEERAVEKSRTQIMEAIDMRPEKVSLLIDGEPREVLAEDVKTGDIAVIKPGERIPLDCLVIEGESRLDTSAITGEPVPVKVAPGSELMSGCINTSGVLKVEILRTLENSMVSRILDAVENAAAGKPKIDKFITRFARVYTPFVVFFAIAIAIIPSFVTGDWEHWVYTALTFLVISCPCALVLSVPLAFFSGIGAGSNRGILFKGGLALEALKKVKMVVMDKTGTLTKGEFSVNRIVYSGSFVSRETKAAGTVSKEEMEKALLALAAGCEVASTHPIGVSIVDAAKKRNVEIAEVQGIKEISGRGIEARLGQEHILCGNRSFMEEMGVKLGTVAELVADKNETEVLIAIDRELAGAMFISDIVKPDSKEAILKLKKMNIQTAMLTGDGKESAETIGRHLGITNVFAKLLPEDKLRILQNLRKEHGTVMFVGDGINDAPVLAGADVGAAMGSGADAAIEAADVVFLSSSLSSVPDAIGIARATASAAMQNVVFALIVKAMVLVLGVMGIASMWLAVFADSGVAVLCVLNAVRILYKYKKIHK